MTSVISMEEWLNATIAATKETVTTMMGSEFAPFTGSLAGSDVSGAYISLTSQSETIQIGLLADREGCHALARAMLGMDEDDESLSDADVGDAIGEILNIVAGVVKRQLNHRVQNSIRLGLPKFVGGNINPFNQKDSKEVNALIGTTASKLLVIKLL